MCTVEQPVTVIAALTVSRLLWPDFVEEHGCVFLGRHLGSNPPPPNDTATGWESFVNHTHIFDEFANGASTLASEEVVYNERHPDFLSASFRMRVGPADGEAVGAEAQVGFSVCAFPCLLHAVRQPNCALS
jgi:hypothetical protein